MGVAALAVGMFVTSAEAKAKTQTLSHHGTFVSASAGKMVMTGRNGKEHTHVVAKNVAVTIEGKPAALAGLKKGMHVSVTTDTNGAVTAISTRAAKPVASASTPVKPASTPAKPATAGK
jgi:hypothetical protein